VGKIVSPARRRQGVDEVQEAFGISERRVCQAIEQPRSRSDPHAKHDRASAHRFDPNTNLKSGTKNGGQVTGAPGE
jgi:hypothetical protein